MCFYHFEYRWLSLRMTFCWVECAATYLTCKADTGMEWVPQIWRGRTHFDPQRLYGLNRMGMWWQTFLPAISCHVKSHICSLSRNSITGGCILQNIQMSGISECSSTHKYGDPSWGRGRRINTYQHLTSDLDHGSRDQISTSTLVNQIYWNLIFMDLHVKRSALPMVSSSGDALQEHLSLSFLLHHVRITTGKAWSWNPWNWNGSAFHAVLKVAMVLKVCFWKLFAIENCQSWLIYGKWWWIPVRKLLVHQRYISLRTKERVLLWYFYL